ncbi:MAG: TetR family transcriptional regulator [Alphaproteobacteria bacterium]|nr:TetR family transcriptional regulator [Alphaproteobacteria bacterium]
MSKTVPRPRTGLSREAIAQTALEIADKHGFEAVSMRRVADVLGVGTMSLYYYVKTKNDLVAAMDDALMGEVLLTSVPKPWKRAMTEIARSTYRMYRRHPWSLMAMLSASPGVNAMRHMEQCLDALAATSMTANQKLTLLTTVDDFVFGHALRAAAASTSADRKLARTQIATGAFPRLKEAFVEAGAKPDEHRFELGLKALLDAAPMGRA